MEFKVSDAQTGQLLSAGVARRVGGKHLMDAWQAWEDVDDALRYWAQMFRYEFCQHRGGSACTPPQTKKTF